MGNSMGNQACCNEQDKDAAVVQFEAIQEDVDQRDDFVTPKVDEISETMPERKGITLLENPVPELSESQEVAQGKDNDPPEAPQEVAEGKDNDPPEAPSAPRQEHGVGIDFDVGGSIKTVTTVRKPLGMIFNPGSPMTVGSLRQGSHAEELGVKPGWVMKAIGGEDVSNMNFAQSLAMLQRLTASLPNESNSVEIVFDKSVIASRPELRQERSVIASRRPFGAVFFEQKTLDIDLNKPANIFEHRKMPLQVKRVKKGSHAEKLCVKPGWIVKAIAGQDVSSMDYDEALDLFKRAFAPLPEDSSCLGSSTPKSSTSASSSSNANFSF